MKRGIVLFLAALIIGGSLTPAQAEATEVVNGEVYARIDGTELVLGNSVVEGKWHGAFTVISQMTDKRTGLVTHPVLDFELEYAEIPGEYFAANSPLAIENIVAMPLPGGGIEATITLAANAGDEASELGTVTRTITAFPGIAGFEIRTEVGIPGLLTGYNLGRVGLAGASTEINSFVAGYDWRGSDTPDWEPSAAPFGGAHTGDHRETQSADAGQSNEGEGEWLSMEAPDGSHAFIVNERVDYASTRMAYGGGTGEASVDLDQDLIYLGPFESDIHVANPNQVPGRARVITPGEPLALEPVFVGFGLDGDDEPWQYYRYLSEHRMPDWGRDVVFNSNGVDTNRISTGAKDDMDLGEVQKQAAIAKRLGVETFILDDGWQAISGDWCPDSPDCPEPRGKSWPTCPAPCYRFPDSTFEAVRAELGDMKLGLWMNPMHFNPAADAYKRNPQWNCEPIGEGLVAANRAQPDSSSNEAGLGTWNPEATGPEGKLIDYIEGHVRNAIDNWGVTYFKFDFLAWIDCVGVESVTAYDYRESFIRMLDRLIEDHPTVTFQIDETNDYRLFPFESVARGPSWYANGGPSTNEALHNLWVLNPWVPGYTIGQQAFGKGRGELSNDYLMAVALGSHMTFFTDLTRFTGDQIEDAAKWTELYRTHRDRFAAFTYPLLDDPISGDNWTALQPWNPDAGTGALLVFRQDAEAALQTVPLRGIRGDGSFVLRDALTDEVFGTFSAEELRTGIDISLPDRHSAKVLLIDPA